MFKFCIDNKPAFITQTVCETSSNTANEGTDIRLKLTSFTSAVSVHYPEHTDFRRVIKRTKSKIKDGQKVKTVTSLKSFLSD